MKSEWINGNEFMLMAHGGVTIAAVAIRGRWKHLGKVANLSPSQAEAARKNGLESMEHIACFVAELPGP
jgi:hypothetical protein